VNIIPSLVEQTAKDLFDRIIYLYPYYQQFQIDIEDGVFIQNKTLSLDDFISYISENHSDLPSSLMYDFHFMAIEYERMIEKLVQIKSRINIDVVFVHSALHPNYSLLQKKYSDFRLGLVINPEETIESLNAHYEFKNIPLIQLMTIHPGPQGQSFIKDVLIKIEQLRSCGFRGKIYIDGAINETSIPLMMDLPHIPDVFCPGSYLAKSPSEDLKRRAIYLRNLNVNSKE
jgi:ribulose-phosphate 3-epimerase